MAVRFKARTVFSRSNTGIVGSNPARGMDVYLHFSVLCCPVQVVALWRADPLSKESYRMSKNRFISFRSKILNRKGPEGLIRIYYKIGRKLQPVPEVVNNIETSGSKSNSRHVTFFFCFIEKFMAQRIMKCA
jgi:hypothetical protein